MRKIGEMGKFRIYAYAAYGCILGAFVTKVTRRIRLFRETAPVIRYGVFAVFSIRGNAIPIPGECDSYVLLKTISGKSYGKFIDRVTDIAMDLQSFRYSAGAVLHRLATLTQDRWPEHHDTVFTGKGRLCIPKLTAQRIYALLNTL